MKQKVIRCDWCKDDALYTAYHDEEWGVPEFLEQALFERLVLEGMQAGLSWLTILRKRQNMREAFYNFEIEKLAAASEQDVQTWMQNSGIIRHAGKLRAMVANARCVQKMDNFPAWIWAFKNEYKENTYVRRDQVPSATSTSIAMSKEMKKLGFKFVGPTICYAFMQSIGMVNDHVVACFRHKPCAALAGASSNFIRDGVSR